MDLTRINHHKKTFDEIVHFIKGEDGKEQIEVWFARELQEVLGYARWENFLTAIGRAVESCKTQKINVDDHFREVTKMIVLAKGATRNVVDLYQVEPTVSRFPSNVNHCREKPCHRND